MSTAISQAPLPLEQTYQRIPHTAMSKRAQFAATVKQLLDAGELTNDKLEELGVESWSRLRHKLRRSGYPELAERLPRFRDRSNANLASGHAGQTTIADQKFRHLVEDLEFLLDPTNPKLTAFEICERLGYQPTAEGLDTLRQKLKRHKRFDLRERVRMEQPREWYMRGTLLHSSALNHRVAI